LFVSDTYLLFDVSANCSKDNTSDITTQRVESNSSLYVDHYKRDEQRKCRKQGERTAKKK
jgi:hypothetical protein